MKKRLLIVCSVLFSSFFGMSQYDCSNNRFIDSLYTVTVHTAVKYGNNVAYNGVSKDLYMNVYTPNGDQMTERPLIIFAPKGSFLQMDRNEWVMQQLCRRFAQMGYVTASIDYRVGIDYLLASQNPQREFTYAVTRAVHDYKAAIRYFRKDFANGNTFGIDNDMIIAGGSSAGAITALHLAYLDQASEIPVGIDTIGYGGQEGLSGNPGYSSSVSYVVSLCGAIVDTNWIHTGDEPLITMHGSADTEVPYGTAVVSMGIPIMEVDGSASIYPRSLHIGLEDHFYTFNGKTHIPYDPNAAGSYVLYMDTVVNYVKTKLHSWMCNAVGIKQLGETNKVMVYPNPARESVTIESSDSEIKDVKITNVFGQIVFQQAITAPLTIVSIENFSEGIYFIRIDGKNYSVVKKLVCSK